MAETAQQVVVSAGWVSPHFSQLKEWGQHGWGTTMSPRAVALGTEVGPAVGMRGEGLGVVVGMVPGEAVGMGAEARVGLEMEARGGRGTGEDTRGDNGEGTGTTEGTRCGQWRGWEWGRLNGWGEDS